MKVDFYMKKNPNEAKGINSYWHAVEISINNQQKYRQILFVVQMPCKFTLYNCLIVIKLQTVLCKWVNHPLHTGEGIHFQSLISLKQAIKPTILKRN